MIQLSIKIVCLSTFSPSCLHHPGHTAGVQTTRTPLSLIPALNLPRLLCYLCPHGSVCACQCGGCCSHEAPGREQQGGTAGGDGGEEGERGAEGEGRGQPAPQHCIRGQRPGADIGHTQPGNRRGRSLVSIKERNGLEVTVTVMAVMISCGRCKWRKKRVPIETC